MLGPRDMLLVLKLLDLVYFFEVFVALLGNCWLSLHTLLEKRCLWLVVWLGTQYLKNIILRHFVLGSGGGSVRSRRLGMGIR